MGCTDGAVDDRIGDQRSRAILDRYQLHLLREHTQAVFHRLRPVLAANGHRNDLVKLSAQGGDLRQQILTGDDHDFLHCFAVLECPHSADDHWLPLQRCHHFINAAHAGCGTCRNDHRTAVFQRQNLPHRTC